MVLEEQRFAQARQIFRQFRRGLERDEEVLREILDALAFLHETYNSSLTGNRFPVGEAMEYIIAAAMRSVGLANVRTVGNNKGRIDIAVGNQSFSLKSSSTGNPDAIGLINMRGRQRVRWDTPTIFILARRGIGYADPDLIPNGANDDVDQLQLQRAPLENLFRESPEWLLECAVPAKQPKPAAGARVRTVSEELANEIVFSNDGNQPRFPRLRDNFQPLDYLPE